MTRRSDVCRLGISKLISPIAIAVSATLTASTLTLSPAAGAEPRAVIELFTSQGCSSCPSADRVLGELARDPSLVTLSLNVDYWDYIGWKDTLALHGHTTRQQAYARTRGDREVYTPQAVVNGVVHVLGSDKAAIERAIRLTREKVQPLTVPVTLKIADGKATVTLPANANAKRGEVWLCPVTSQISVAVGRGENRGRELTYHNVVRGWTKLGDYTGKAETFSVPLSSFAGKDIDRLAVVVQNGEPSRPSVMVGAAVASIR
ncbi:MAG: DUF1223 domain-containing protein [Pseudolabrys sp.]